MAEPIFVITFSDVVGMALVTVGVCILGVCWLGEKIMNWKYNRRKKNG